jgi:uncharacterized repeat protein (TIGR01451 family)
MAKTLRILLCVFIMCLLTFFIFIHPASSDESANKEIPLNQYGIRSTNPYVVDRFIENGKTIEAVVVPGSPHPPQGVVRAQVAKLPVPNIAAGINTISKVPAMKWAFGCAATSAAMMFGHYDNSGYPNMYTGPTNGGDFPMTNELWGTFDFGNGDGPMALCPLSATRNGLDGRAIRGHVDDYWIKYGNAGPDPFIGHWTEHTQGECTGDYMGTNQSSLSNNDGSTYFYWYTDGKPFYDYIAPAGHRDGCHGLKLFVESRGYTVQANGDFTQLIYGYNGNTQGFTYANFKEEINAGRPVLIQLEGHTMLGYGYNDPSTIYVHDTFDYLNHSMTWGGTYGNMQHFAVTVLRLAAGSAEDMHIAMAGSQSTVIVGDNITYAITVTENGPSGTMNASVTDVLPVGVTFVSATSSQGTCSGTSTVTCNLGSMSASSIATISLVVTTTAANAALENTATLTSDDLTNPLSATTSTVVNINNPVPVMSSISPSVTTVDGAAFTLTVNGSNFVSRSKVQWQGTDRVTTFVSTTQLTAAILAADILTVGTATVTVVNPAPGGGTSNTLTFTTSDPSPTNDPSPTSDSSPATDGGGGGGGCFIATAWNI